MAWGASATGHGGQRETPQPARDRDGTGRSGLRRPAADGHFAAGREAAPAAFVTICT